MYGTQNAFWLTHWLKVSVCISHGMYYDQRHDITGYFIKQDVRSMQTEYFEDFTSENSHSSELKPAIQRPLENKNGDRMGQSTAAKFTLISLCFYACSWIICYGHKLPMNYGPNFSDYMVPI